MTHYLKRELPQWTEFSLGKNNFKWEPLLDPRKVLFPPLHSKLGLMKPFVRALHKESLPFKHPKDFFPKMSATKVEPGHRIERVSQKNKKKLQGWREQHGTVLSQLNLALGELQSRKLCGAC